VQVSPHITDGINSHICNLGEAGDYDVVINEIGGTVGDIESLPYIEAVRQFRQEVGKQNALSIHLTLIPYLAAARELKTKPTQHSVKTLSESGLQPDMIVARSEYPLDETIRQKIALFCNVENDDVNASLDQPSNLKVPFLMQQEGMDEQVIEKLNLPAEEPELENWENFVLAVYNPSSSIKIALVGKYVEHHDAYKSIVEAFIHAGAVNDCRVDIEWIHAENGVSNN